MRRDMISEPRSGDEPLYSPRLLLLGAVIAGVLILALVGVITHRASPSVVATPHASHPSATRPSAVAPTASPAPSGASSPSSSDARCNIPPGSQEVPTSAPTGVTWQLYQTIALPFSAQAGPTVVSGGVARCYAHTPTGALLAAVQIYVRLGVAPDWLPVLDQQVMPGTGREVFAADRPDEDVTVQPGEYGQVAGFQFVTYSSAGAVVQLVVQMPDGSLQMAAVTVTWFGGDWRLQLLPDGQATAIVQQLSSLAGFIPWEGV